MALLAIAILGSGFDPLWTGAPRDFEECSAQAEVGARSNDERHVLIADCERRFAGRRKPNGGYTFYDFMQNRSFDIAGPNPTAEELKKIDRAYMSFLDSRSRDAISAGSATTSGDQPRPDLDKVAAPVGRPLDIRPAIPKSKGSTGVERSIYGSPACDPNSFSCRLMQFSAEVRSAFASFSAPNPNIGPAKETQHPHRTSKQASPEMTQ